MPPKRKTHFGLTGREIWLATALALMGFAFSTRTWLLWENTLNPIQGLIVYYIILYGSLFALSRLGLTVFGIKIDKPLQTFGLLCITFGFFCVVDMSSAWTTIATGGNTATVSPIYWQCEDGAVYYIWNLILPWASAEILRLLTYVFTPAVLALIGSYFVSGKIKLH